MARVACARCPREFKTQNGLAWHVSREHADAGVRGNGDGNAEDQGTHEGFAAGEVASAVPEMTVDGLSDWLAEFDATMGTTTESLSSVRDRLDGLSARFGELESKIAGHIDDHAAESSSLRAEVGNLRDQIQAVSLLVYGLDWDRREANDPTYVGFLRLAHTPDVEQLNQARQTVERVVDAERGRFLSERMDIDLSAVPTASSWQRSQP